MSEDSSEFEDSIKNESGVGAVRGLGGFISVKFLCKSKPEAKIVDKIPA